MRERALILAPEPPYPLIGGGPIRTASLYEYLRRFYEVRVITFEPAGRSPDTICLPPHSKSKPVRVLRNLWRAARGVPPLVDRFSSQRRQLSVLLEREHFQLCVAEHFWCAPYAPLLRRHSDTLWLDLHNIDSVFYRRLAAVEPWPVSSLLGRFAESSARLERQWLPFFDKVLVTSAADARHVQAYRPVVYPNALPYHEKPVAHRSHSLVFSANFEYQPNQSGLRWFVTHVWPRLSTEWPQLTLRLVGRNPESITTFLRGPRIEVIGPVDEAIPAIAASEIAIVPLLTGSGTRIKILEAWAACVPVVSTAIGAEGLEGEPGREYLLADTPGYFSAAISRLLSDKRLAREIATAGRALYERDYCWPAVWDRLEAHLP